MTRQPETMNAKQQKKAESRERILKEAAAAVRLEGADRVSVSTIMARAGMTVGGFYAHFASKDELLAMAVRYMFEDRYHTFLEHLGDPDAGQTLLRFVETYLSMGHRNAVERGCPIPALAGEISRLDPQVRAEFVRGIETLESAVSELLSRLGQQDPADLGVSVIAEMTGALSLARSQPDIAKAQRMLSASRSQVRHRLGL